MIEVIESYRVTRSQQFNKALPNKETASSQMPWQPWGILKWKHNSVFLTEYHQVCRVNYFSIYGAHCIVQPTLLQATVSVGTVFRQQCVCVCCVDEIYCVNNVFSYTIKAREFDMGVKVQQRFILFKNIQCL